MGDTAKDPVDHARTTRPHAGETMKDSANLPALIVLFVALVSLVACLFAFGTSHHDAGAGLAYTSGALFVIAGLWFGVEHWRVRRKHREWNAQHPENAA